MMKEEPMSPSTTKALQGAQPKPRAALEAENARLQERVEEAERHLGESWHLWKQCQYRKGIVEREHDWLQTRVTELETSYLGFTGDELVAQSEQRRKALDEAARRVHHREEHPVVFEECQRADCYQARAAIDVTPEQAREKERQ